MFCDKMAGARVQASRKKAGHHEVNKRTESECLDEEDVKGNLGKEVVDVPFRWCLSPYKARPESVKKYLK